VADRLTTDTLFLACTRPALLWGVPHEAAVLNGMATMILFVLVKHPLYLSIGVVLHFIARQLVSHDYNMFSVLRLWINTKGRAKNVEWWGGSSVSPLPTRPARKAGEVRFYV
jgi:type IV secretion system protein VirB3